MDIKELNVNDEQETSQNHPWEFARSKVIKHLLKKYFHEIGNPVVMDVGCGDVFFLNEFCKTYPSVKPVAVDTAFDKEIVSSLSQKYNDIKVAFFNDIEEVSTEGKKTSVVFLMDVIEHIEHDVDFLNILSKKDFIGDDTLFMLTVPAFNNLYCSHDKWLGHYRRYDSKMLKEHTEQAGLKLVEGGYFFTTLILPRWLQKKMESSEKMEKEVTGIGGWKGGRIVSKLYEWALLCDFYFFRFFRIFGIKFPGLSTYAICKRQS